MFARTLIAWLFPLSIGLAAGGYMADRVHTARAAKQESAHKAELISMQEAARRRETELQGKADEAIRQANKRAQDNARAAGAARSQLDGLRNELAAGAGAPACTAGVVAADPAREILGQCAEALADLAVKADGHASDALKLHQAWPR